MPSCRVPCAACREGEAWRASSIRMGPSEKSAVCRLNMAREVPARRVHRQGLCSESKGDRFKYGRSQPLEVFSRPPRLDPHKTRKAKPDETIAALYQRASKQHSWNHYGPIDSGTALMFPVSMFARAAVKQASSFETYGWQGCCIMFPRAMTECAQCGRRKRVCRPSGIEMVKGNREYCSRLSRGVERKKIPQKIHVEVRKKQMVIWPLSLAK